MSQFVHTRSGGVAAAAPALTSPTALRVAAAAGFASAAILLLNAAKRADLVPTSALTQLVAPLAQGLAIVFVVGLAGRALRKGGWVATAALSLNVLALATLVGVEFVINLVFLEVEPSLVTALRASALGTAFTVASVTFLLATWLFVAVLLGTEVPRVPLALYALAAAPIALRAFVPEAALQVGLVGLAVAIFSMALWLCRHAEGWADRRGARWARTGGNGLL